MTWNEICDSQVFRDLPFKVETNRQGQIIMSPARNFHGILQVRIASLLERFLPEGVIISECGIDTNDGVKVADVAWYEEERLLPYLDEVSYPIAGDICVEVDSPSNTKAEMRRKRRLYAEKGAKEFWQCGEDGRMSFYDAVTGESLSTSRLCPDFPAQIPLRRRNSQ